MRTRTVALFATLMTMAFGATPRLITETDLYAFHWLADPRKTLLLAIVLGGLTLHAQVDPFEGLWQGYDGEVLNATASRDCRRSARHGSPSMRRRSMRP